MGREQLIQGVTVHDASTGVGTDDRSDRAGLPSHRRSFLGEPHISSDFVLKPVIQRPRTQS
jgi:hypothetical protein